MHHCVADLEWGERCLVAKKEVPPPVERQLGLPLEGK
jgi:hypothetical protein